MQSWKLNPSRFLFPRKSIFGVKKPNNKQKQRKRDTFWTKCTSGDLKHIFHILFNAFPPLLYPTRSTQVVLFSSPDIKNKTKNKKRANGCAERVRWCMTLPVLCELGFGITQAVQLESRWEVLSYCFWMSLRWKREQIKQKCSKL